MIRALGGALALTAAAVAAGATIGTTIRSADRTPVPWRALTAEESRQFDLGYAVFNTTWVEANDPPGQRDGLGPLFNAASCDACHNSRRRGRGPEAAGVAPQDLVIQVGTRDARGRVVRGTQRFGAILNTAANGGLRPEAAVSIQYRDIVRTRADGTRVTLFAPDYRIVPTDGGALSADTVLMPRMPPPVQGDGLLERVPQAEILALAQAQAHAGGPVHGRVAWLKVDGKRTLGRFGWQGTQPSVEGQINTAFAREMGLTTPAMPHIDCGAQARDCLHAPSGGDPEVEPPLFEAVVAFQRLEAVERTEAAARLLATSDEGRRLFAQTGCAACHVPRLRIEPVVAGEEQDIEPYTDLLLHDLGAGLADRDATGRALPGAWRTAPLWGLNLSFATGRPVRLLHDGRARSLDEAIEWHDGEAADARRRYEHLSAAQRRALLDWVGAL